MADLAAEIFLFALATYAALGLIFALAFVWVGAKKVDPQAAGSGIGFRLLLLPGVTAFWPLLLRRWMAGNGEAPDEENPHR